MNPHGQGDTVWPAGLARPAEHRSTRGNTMTTAYRASTPTAALSAAAAQIADYLDRDINRPIDDDRLAGGLLRVATRCAEVATRNSGCAYDIAEALKMSLSTIGRTLPASSGAELRGVIAEVATSLRACEAAGQRSLPLGDPLRLALGLAAYLDAVSLALAGNSAAVSTAQHHLLRDARSAARAWQPGPYATADLTAVLRESRQDRRRPGAA